MVTEKQVAGILHLMHVNFIASDELGNNIHQPTYIPMDVVHSTYFVLLLSLFAVAICA